MKASELISELQNQVSKMGDLEVAVVTYPTTNNLFWVGNEDNYLDKGLGIFPGSGVEGKIVIPLEDK